MWTGIILICAAVGSTDCITVSGPTFKTEEACLKNIVIEGAPYAQTKLKGTQKMEAYRCVYWNMETSI